LTSHGSGAAVAVGAGNDGADGGSAVEGAGDAAVGSGVLETVESLDPHPATVRAAATNMTAHFTKANLPKPMQAITKARGGYGRWWAVDSAGDDVFRLGPEPCRFAGRSHLR